MHGVSQKSFRYHCRLNSASLEQVQDFFFPNNSSLDSWTLNTRQHCCFNFCGVMSIFSIKYFRSYCIEVFSNSLGILLVLHVLCPSKPKHPYLPFSLSLEKIWLSLLLSEIQICVEQQCFKIVTHMYKLSEVRIETTSYKAGSSIAVFLNSQANCICSQMFQLHNVLMLITVIK